MNSRERLLTVLKGNIPDYVPVAPDFSNMIPARRTGKPFWDLYLYNNPPIWEAYIDCARHFGIDSVMDGHFPFRWPSDEVDPRPWEMFIVYRDAERIVTQASFVENSRRVWQERVNVYYASDPPTWGVDPAMIGLSAVPSHYEPLEGARTVDNGIAGLGDQGVVGVFLTYSSVVGSEEGVYHFADHPEELEKVKADRLAQVERRFADLMAMQTQDRPDFLCVGGSGTLIFQSPAFFREHAFPAVKRAIGTGAHHGRRNGTYGY